MSMNFLVQLGGKVLRNRGSYLCFVATLSMFFFALPFVSEAKVVFITSGTTWTVPADWSDTNSIECIGGGAGGGTNAGSDYGAGGGGGAYSKKNNLTGLNPGNTVSIQIGSGGTANTAGGDTWFNGGSLGASSCGAQGGQVPTVTNKIGGLGGSASSGVGDTKYSGGNGGNAGGGSETSGAGGGGAAGPNGDGARGGNLFTSGGFGSGSGAANGGSQGVDQSSAAPTDGGNNRNGTGGGAAGSGSVGAQGTNGAGSGGGAFGFKGGDGSQDSIWTQTSDSSLAGPGSGGGGSGGTSNVVGAGGALYGGGGGGGSFNGSNNDGGQGGQGIIVVTYTPTLSTTNPTNIARAVNNLGLMGYWPLNELTNSNSLTLDYSGNHNDIVTSGPSQVTGKVGKALNFNSASAQYGYGALNGTSLTQTSISFWVKPTVLPSGQSGMFQWAQTLGSGTPFILIAYNSSGQITVYVDGGYQITTSLPLQTWSHVTLTLDAGNMWHLYINGIQVGTYHDDSTHDGQSNGIQAYIGNGYSSYFDGVIDELRIYNRELPASEIINIYKSSATSHKSSSNLGLVGYWSLNDGSGNSAQDFSGNHRDGVLSTDGNGVPLWTLGKAGFGLSFSAAAQRYVSLPDNLIRTTVGTTGSFHMWFKTTTYGPLLGYNTNNLSEYVPILYVGSDGLLYGEVWMGAVTPMASLRTVNDGKWHLASLVWSGASQSLYLDGVLVAGPLSGTVTHLNMNINTIGKAYSSSGWTNSTGSTGYIYFTGSIDEVRAYNRALSSDEVLALYNTSGKAITANTTRTELVKSGLIGYWPFDGKYMNWGTGKALDVTSAGNDGIIQSLSTTTSPRMGKVGQALNFNGVNNRINVSGINIANSSFSVGAWVKHAATGIQEFVLSQGSSSADNMLHFGFRSNNAFTCAFFADDLDTGTSYPDQDWHHWMCTYNAANNTRTIYRDGVAVGSDTATGDFQGTGTLYIGYQSDINTYFHGLIDEVRVYNRTLTPSEVVQIYNSGK